MEEYWYVVKCELDVVVKAPNEAEAKKQAVTLIKKNVTENNFQLASVEPLDAHMPQY